MSDFKAKSVDGIPNITSMLSRLFGSPYAEMKAGGFLVASAVALIFCWSTFWSLSAIVKLLLTAVWFAAIRVLARGGDAGLSNDLNLSGKTVVVTGGNGGIGYETCVYLAQHGATVLIGCRDARRGAEAHKQIVERVKAAGGSGSGSGSAGVADRVKILELDLVNFASVRSFARAVLEQTASTSLDVLINNAASGPTLERTGDDIDFLIATNHLGPMLLTLLLLPKLKQTAGARIVNVSSGAHDLVPVTRSIDEILGIKPTPGYEKMMAYSHSKLCNVLFTIQLQRLLAAGGHSINAYSAHPGSIATDLLRREGATFMFVLKMISNVLFKTAVGGAQTTLYCAFNAGAKPGWYHADNQASPLFSRPVSETAFYEEFWAKSLKLIDPKGTGAPIPDV